MKNFKHLLAIAGISAAAVSPSALAFTVNFEKGKFQSGSGGEFVALTSVNFLDNYSAEAKQTVVDNSGHRVVGFSTFCLEVGESLNFTDTYAGELNLRAMNGGPDLHDPNGAGPAGDPISLGTAWLYQLFATGTLDDVVGYDYGTYPHDTTEVSNRKTSAGLLQNAIWHLEDEPATVDSNPYIAAVISEFGSLENAQVSSEGAYGVMAINVSLNGEPRQDVLVYTVPDGGMTVALLGGGVLGLALVQRRKQA